MMDPAKLKVVELRAELGKRGLDQRGVKAVLVARLQEALEAEEKEDDEEQGEDEVSSEHGEEIIEASDNTEQSKTEAIGHDETSVQSVQSSEQDLPHHEEDSSQFVSYQEESESKLISEVNEDSIAKSMEENSEVSSEVPTADESSIQNIEQKESRPVEEISGESSRFSVVRAATQPHTVSHLDSEPDVSKQDEEMKDNEKGYEDFSDYLVQEDSSSKINFEDQSMDTWNQTGQVESERSFQIQDSSLHLDDSNAQDALENRPKSDLEDAKPDVKDSNIEVDKGNETTMEVEAGDVKPPGMENQDETTPAKEPKEEEESAEPCAVESNADQETKEGPTKEDEKMPKSDRRDDNEKDRKNRWDDNRSSEAKKRQRSPGEKRRWSPPRKPDDEPDYDENAVVLSWYDSDLHMMINKENFFSGTVISHSGFGYVWAGARASFGFEKGKVYYEAKITENLKVPYLENEPNPNVLRVGWSVQKTSLQLGEEAMSYGFGATGKKSTKCQFHNYGKAFSVNDVVGCFLDMDSNPIEISYSINGEYQGVAFSVDREEIKGQPLFPHVLTKNCGFEVNFGAQEPWFQPLSDYVNVGKVQLEDRIPGPKRLTKREDCEVIMMVGLPGSGKTTWAMKYAEDHKDKMYNVLGTNVLIDKMKVMGMPRIRNYSGRWENLIAKCTKCLNTLLEIGAYRRRNYIIDQTNVYPSAQRRKMRGFEGFVRRAVVIVPTDEELKSRTAKREAEEGKDVPDSAVMEMKANFVLPEKGEIFNEVVFAELQEEEAKALIARYNREANEAGFSTHFQQQKRFRMDDGRDRRDFRDNRQEGQDRGRMDNRGRMDSRGGHDGWRDRGFNNNRRRPDNRGGMGGPPRPGNWRDNRGFNYRGGGGGGGGGGWRGGPPNRFNDRGGPGPRYMRDRNRDYRDRRDNNSGGNKMPDRRNNDRDDKNRSKSMNQGQSQNWGGQSQGNYNQTWGQGYGNQAWGNWNQGYNQQQWKGYGQQQQQQQQQNWGQQGWGNQGWTNASWNQQYYNQYQQNWAQQQPQQSQQQQQSLQHTQQQQTHHQSSGTSDSAHTGGADNSVVAAYAGYSSAGTPQAGTWAGYTTVGNTGYASMGAAAPVGSAAGMSGGGSGGGGSTGGLSAPSFAPNQKQYRQDPRKAS